jgi:hypothetical protein
LRRVVGDQRLELCRRRGDPRDRVEVRGEKRLGLRQEETALAGFSVEEPGEQFVDGRQHLIGVLDPMRRLGEADVLPQGQPARDEQDDDRDVERPAPPVRIDWKWSRGRREKHGPWPSWPYVRRIIAEASSVC